MLNKILKTFQYFMIFSRFKDLSIQISYFWYSVKRAELTCITENGSDPNNNYYQLRQYINHQDDKIASELYS